VHEHHPDPDPAKWREDDRGYADVPVSRKPLDDLQIAGQLPTLGIHNGDRRPHVRGKLREYIVLQPGLYARVRKLNAPGP
jgi:hypothetical protein